MRLKKYYNSQTGPKYILDGNVITEKQYKSLVDFAKESRVFGGSSAALSMLVEDKAGERPSGFFDKDTLEKDLKPVTNILNNNNLSLYDKIKKSYIELDNILNKNVYFNSEDHKVNAKKWLVLRIVDMICLTEPDILSKTFCCASQSKSDDKSFKSEQQDDKSEKSNKQLSLNRDLVLFMNMINDMLLKFQLKLNKEGLIDTNLIMSDKLENPLRELTRETMVLITFLKNLNDNMLKKMSQYNLVKPELIYPGGKIDTNGNKLFPNLIPFKPPA